MMRMKSQGEEEDQEDGKPNSHMEVSAEWGDRRQDSLAWPGVYQITN